MKWPEIIDLYLLNYEIRKESIFPYFYEFYSLLFVESVGSSLTSIQVRCPQLEHLKTSIQLIILLFKYFLGVIIEGHPSKSHFRKTSHLGPPFFRKCPENSHLKRLNILIIHYSPQLSIKIKILKKS